MSGVRIEGHLVTRTRARAMTGFDSISFLQHLHGYFGCKLLVIWDGAPIHRSKEVKEFLADGWTRQIHLERFPAYAPELNPDEGVWQYLKHVELRNLCCFDFNHLCIELSLAIKRVRSKPDLIQSFFAGARLDR
jgi:transposase